MNRTDSDPVDHRPRPAERPAAEPQGWRETCDMFVGWYRQETGTLPLTGRRPLSPEPTQ